MMRVTQIGGQGSGEKLLVSLEVWHLTDLRRRPESGGSNRFWGGSEGSPVMVAMIIWQWAPGVANDSQ